MGRRVRHISTREVGAYLILDARTITGSAGAAIRVWNDISGNGRDAVMTGSAYPVVVAHKGYSAPNFATATRRLEISGSITSQPYMAFIYGYGNGGGGLGLGYWYSEDSAVSRSLVYWFQNTFAPYPNQDVQAMEASNEAFQKSLGGPSLMRNNCLWGFKFNGVSSSIYSNSLLWITGSVNTGSLTTSGLTRGMIVGNSYDRNASLLGVIDYLSITPILPDIMRKRIDQSICFKFRHTTYGK